MMTIKRLFRKEYLSPISLLLIFFTLMALYLRLKGLTYQSFWGDELGSAYFALTKSLPKIIQACVSDFNPPFYYISLRIWTLLFGGTEFSIRMLSAVTGFLGVISIYYIGKELFSKTVGFYALALTSVNIFQISYSQEARSYAFVFLLTCLSFFFFVKLQKIQNIKTAVFYILTASLLIYSHYFGLLILASQFFIYVFIFIGEKEKFLSKKLNYFFVSFVSIAILYLPWLPSILKLSKTGSFWTGKPAPDFYTVYLKVFLGFESLLVVLFSVLLLIYILSKTDQENFPQHKILLFIWMFIPLFLPYLRSFSSPSPLTERNTIVVLPALFLMVSQALASLDDKYAKNFIFSIMILLSLVNIFLTYGNYYKKTIKEPWRDIAAFVLDNDPKGKYPVYGHPLYDYYLNNIYGGKRIINGEINLVKIVYDIETGRADGAWILEGHIVTPQDSVNHDYLMATLVKARVLNLYRVRATLYVHPLKLEVPDRLARIPLTSIMPNGRIHEQQDELINAPWNVQLVTPEYNFPKGRYLIRISAKGSEAQGVFSRLRVAAAKTEKIIYLKDEYDDYNFTFSIAEAGKYRIFIEFDNDEFDEVTRKDRNVLIQSIELQKLSI